MRGDYSLILCIQEPLLTSPFGYLNWKFGGSALSAYTWSITSQNIPKDLRATMRISCLKRTVEDSSCTG
jgi:hypothetical protein